MVGTYVLNRCSPVRTCCSARNYALRTAVKVKCGGGISDKSVDEHGHIIGLINNGIVGGLPRAQPLNRCRKIAYCTDSDITEDIRGDRQSISANKAPGSIHRSSQTVDFLTKGRLSSPRGQRDQGIRIGADHFYSDKPDLDFRCG